MTPGILFPNSLLFPLNVTRVLLPPDCRRRALSTDVVGRLLYHNSLLAFEYELFGISFSLSILFLDDMTSDKLVKL